MRWRVRVDRTYSRQTPACSYAVEGNHDKAGKTTICDADFTLANMTSDIERSVGDWNRYTEFSMNLNEDFGRCYVLCKK